MIEEAVYSAVSHFNDGRSSLILLFEVMNIVPGIFTSYSCQRQDTQRITSSLTKSSTPAKKEKAAKSKKERLSRSAERNRRKPV